MQGSVQSTMPADPMQTLPAGQDPGHDPAMGGPAGRATQVVVAASFGNTQVQTPPRRNAPGMHALQVPVQMALAQSLRLRHPLPTAQGGQSGPPQSTSVSRPFLTPSLHVGDRGVRGVALRVQVPLWQVPSEHSVPFAFALHLHCVLPDLDLCFFVF